MEKKKKPEIKDLLKISEVKEFKLDKFISKNIANSLKKKYGKVLFPFLGVALEDKKEILLLVYEKPEDAKTNKVLIFHSANLTKESLKEFLDFVSKTKR